MHRVDERRVIKGGGQKARYSALVKSGNSAFRWNCDCSVDDEHDHEAVIEELGRKLEKNDTLTSGYAGLVGTEGRLGLIRYKITDCHVQIWGPKRFSLYVAWTVQPLDETIPPTMDGIRKVAEDPSDLPSPEWVYNTIQSRLTATGDAVAKLIRSAGEFSSK